MVSIYATTCIQKISQLKALGQFWSTLSWDTNANIGNEKNSGLLKISLCLGRHYNENWGCDSWIKSLW